MKEVIILAALTLSLGCGKKEPAQPSASNTEATKQESTKAKTTAGVKLWKFETGGPVSSSPAIWTGWHPLRRVR